MCSLTASSFGAYCPIGPPHPRVGGIFKYMKDNEFQISHPKSTRIGNINNELQKNDMTPKDQDNMTRMSYLNQANFKNQIIPRITDEITKKKDAYESAILQERGT